MKSRTQAQARREAEEQLQVLVESSPAAIVTLDADGTILLANEAAQQMLAPEDSPLRGQSNARLPARALFRRAVPNLEELPHHPAVQGNRRNGEVFLAGVWFST